MLQEKERKEGGGFLYCFFSWCISELIRNCHFFWWETSPLSLSLLLSTPYLTLSSPFIIQKRKKQRGGGTDRTSWCLSLFSLADHTFWSILFCFFHSANKGRKEFRSVVRRIKKKKDGMKCIPFGHLLDGLLKLVKRIPPLKLVIEGETRRMRSLYKLP